tara:strand:+ start:3669 stop:4421 length:753 start_codon:yes stop_codon:yes gene_type:complete
LKQDLCFNPEAAQMYGVDGAIMLHHLAFWVYRNKLNEKNEIDGHTWTWNSARAYTEIFPFWKNNQIRRILMNLEKDGAILSAVHNRARWDRTKWYTVTDKVQSFYHFQKSANASKEIVKSIPKKKKMDVKKSKDQYQILTSDKTQILTSDEQEIVFPFEGDEFSEAWKVWLDERKIKKKAKYTQRGEQAQLFKLKKISGDNEKIAIEIIQEAITEGWAGMHPLKNDKRNKTTQEFDKSKLLDHLKQTHNT